MPHWDHGDDAPRFKELRFNQPYAKGLRRLREEVLAKTDFDPATLFQWGTMQAMALLAVLDPHQDHYGAFDCRIQRYFVQGMIDAAVEVARMQGWQVKFDSTIPAGAKTCHFTLWKATEQEAAEWGTYTKLLEAKALVRSKRKAEGA